MTIFGRRVSFEAEQAKVRVLGAQVPVNVTPLMRDEVEAHRTADVVDVDPSWMLFQLVLKRSRSGDETFCTINARNFMLKTFLLLFRGRTWRSGIHPLDLLSCCCCCCVDTRTEGAWDDLQQSRCSSFAFKFSHQMPMCSERRRRRMLRLPLFFLFCNLCSVKSNFFRNFFAQFLHTYMCVRARDEISLCVSVWVCYRPRRVPPTDWLTNRVSEGARSLPSRINRRWVKPAQPATMPPRRPDPTATS